MAHSNNWISYKWTCTANALADTLLHIAEYIKRNNLEVISMSTYKDLTVGSFIITISCEE